MDEGLPVGRANGPGSRQMLYGLGFIATVIALVAIAIVVLVLPAIACGCTTPPDLVIVNRSHEAVSVDWRAGGVPGTPLLGAGGNADAGACAVTSLSLERGDVTATLRTGDRARTILLAVGRGGDRRPGYLLVAPDGTVGDLLSDWPPGTDDTSGCP